MRSRHALSAALVLGGLVSNPWFLGYVAVEDGSIDPFHVSALLLFLSSVFVLSALHLQWRWVDRVSWRAPAGIVRVAAVVGVVALVISGTYWRIATYNERHRHTMLVPTGSDSVSPEQQRWAEDFYQRSLAAAIEHGWFDINRAFAQGFQADRVNGTHFPNTKNMFDDAILDPERPEWLIYHDSPEGKTLMGFMFFTRELEETGPTPAGPLAQWHYHPYEMPRCAIKGLWTVARPDENGTCKEGIPVDRTPEMFHVWFVDHPLGRFSDMSIVPQFGQDDDVDPSRLHPIVVHFAIGLFVTAVLLDLVAYVFGRRDYHRAAWLNLVLAAVAAIAAAGAGMTAELALKPTHETHQVLDMHKLYAFAAIAGILTLATWRFALRGRFPHTGAVLYIALSLAGIGAIGGAGYYGGEMVYEHGAGVRAFDRFARDQYLKRVRQVYLPQSGATTVKDGVRLPAAAHAGH